jgi:prepilin-type N-terminal cleavage/methylation domain-containing protein
MIKNRQRNLQGMSLIEVVIAIAISGFILASAASFVVSITDIWSKREQRYAFFEHADGVTQFLKTNFLSAQIIPNEENTFQNNTNTQSSSPSQSIQQNSSGISIQTNTQTNNNTGNQEQTTFPNQQSDTNIFWQNPEFNKSSDDPLLSLQIRENTPLLTNPEGILPLENTLYLYFDPDEGLSLVHSSSLNEAVESEDDYQRTMLSPYVKEMKYIYWDSESETWESLDEPMTMPEGDYIYLIPNFIQLSFEYNETQIKRIIPIPKHSKHLILY